MSIGEDIEITKRLAEAGRVLGIKLLDHLVLGSPAGARAMSWFARRVPLISKRPCLTGGHPQASYNANI